MKIGHLPGHANDGFLDDLLCFLIAQSGAQGRPVNKLPVRVEKLPPT